MKEKWFEYVVNNKNHWCYGFTLKRLERIKVDVLNDKNILFDLLERHSAKESSPEDMKTNDAFQYNHCIGNFSCNIFNKMIEKGVIKIK